MATLANVGDTYINELRRRKPQEQTIVLAAAIMVRNELEDRFKKWAIDLQKPEPAEESKKEEVKA